MSATDVTAELVKHRAVMLGADLCGIADAGSFAGAPPGHQPRDILPQCVSVIVLACKFPYQELEIRGDEYTIARDQIALRMDTMAVALAEELSRRDFPSVGLSSNGDVRWEEDAGRFRARLSMKHAAELAGLGRIGRNTLLVNQDFGNMIWIGAVLTEARLLFDPPASYQTCPPRCTVCLSSCPAGALGQSSMRQQACFGHAYRACTERQDGRQQIILCNICRVVCPNVLGLRYRPQTACP